MRDNQYGLYSMFGRGYNFLKRKSFGLLGLAGLTTAFLVGAPDAQAQEAGLDLDEMIDEIHKEKEESSDESSRETDIKSENQRRFAEVYEEMREESKKAPKKGYFAEGRVSGVSNKETEYDSWRTSIEIGKYAFGEDKRWNGRFRFDYDDTDGREERFELSGRADYRFTDWLTAGFKAFGGDHTAGGEGRIRINIDLGTLWDGMLFARGGGSYLEDRITDVNTIGFLDSDQTVRDGFGEVGLKFSSKEGLYFSVSDVFKWVHTEMSPNIPTSVGLDMEMEMNALVGSFGLRKNDYSVDFTGVWTHTRTKDNFAPEDSVERDDMLRGQATGFYHIRGQKNGHSIGLMLGGDKNGWDVRGIYIFQEGRSSLAKELESLKTAKDEISREEIRDRLEALSSVCLWVHKFELGGRRNEVPGARSWEVFGNYGLTVSMNSKAVDQIRLTLEGTYGELNPRYGPNQRYFRGSAEAEFRFGNGFYLFGGANGTAREGQRPCIGSQGGLGWRF